MDPGTNANTLNWLSWASLTPTLRMVAAKPDSDLRAAVDSDVLDGHPFRLGGTGPPISDEVHVLTKCRLSGKPALRGHTAFVGEAVAASHRRVEEPLEMLNIGWFHGD
jgi:flavin reductase (DIM6/NTAB) family NADH-FMN oxidoreductase RutF